MRPLLRSAAEAFAALAVVVALGWVALQYCRPVRVAGGSMRPALYPGDLAIVDTRAKVAASQIALLRSARHGLVLHRVTAMQPDGSVRTQGDANPIEDFDSVPATGVVGPVVLVAPVGKLIARWRDPGVCATMTAQ